MIEIQLVDNGTSEQLQWRAYSECHDPTGVPFMDYSPWSAVPIVQGEHIGSDAAELSEPTLEQLSSACLSYRHDYGLLSDSDRELMRYEANEWLKAWRKELSV